MAEDQRLKLTALGDLARRHGTMTPPKWFQDNWRDIRRAAEADTVWEQLVNERIAALTEMRDRFYELINEPR